MRVLDMLNAGELSVEQEQRDAKLSADSPFRTMPPAALVGELTELTSAESALLHDTVAEQAAHLRRTLDVPDGASQAQLLALREHALRGLAARLFGARVYLDERGRKS